jgi:hypothetical protein
MTDYLIASLSMPLGPIPVIIVLDKIADLIAENFFEGDRGMGILGFLMLFYVASVTSNLFAFVVFITGRPDDPRAV